MATEAISSAWKVIPGLQSTDILRTTQYYTDVLHFHLEGVHQDADDQPPSFSSVSVGDKAVVNIYHQLCAPADFTPGWVLVAMGNEQLDRYYEALMEAGGVEIVEELGDKPWGYRQFSVKDVDGNKLSFFRLINGGNPSRE